MPVLQVHVMTRGGEDTALHVINCSDRKPALSMLYRQGRTVMTIILGSFAGSQLAQDSHPQLLTSPNNQPSPIYTGRDRLTGTTCPSPSSLVIASLFSCRSCATAMTDRRTTKNIPAMVHPIISPTLLLLVLLFCQFWIYGWVTHMICLDVLVGTAKLVKAVKSRRSY